MRVLVAGATGFVGSHLVPALVAAGHDVRALVREPTSYDSPDGVEPVEGDLLHEASLTDVFADIDAAYYLVHSMGAGPGFAERDRTAAQNFAAAADATGVDRVVYLGGLGETGDDLSPHLASRREVEAVLADAAFDLTTLRAAVIVGAGSAGFDVVYQLIDSLPVMITPKWVRTPCQPIAVADMVAYLVGVLDHPETAGETYEVGGPDVLSYELMLERTASIAGKRIWVLPVPVLSPKLSTYWVDLITDVPRSVARPLIHGLKNPVVVSDHSIQDVVHLDLTSFDEAARRALREYGEAVDG